jgi:lipopolysaccharide export system permease protein
MKILTRYILREHIGPFLLAFLTITFLLIIDLVPKIIDHIIDKDLEVAVVFEIIGLNLAWMLALSIPMSVLVATLMAFGRDYSYQSVGREFASRVGTAVGRRCASDGRHD